MAAYKLSKNGWVMPFFVIFSLREKLLVTVAFDHPVSLSLPNVTVSLFVSKQKKKKDGDTVLYLSADCH